MNSGKRISAWWNSLLCWLFGHSLTTICTRCGKFVDLEGTKRPTLEERINNYFKNRKERKLNPDKPLFKGSLKLKTGLKKYSINLLTNELRLVEYIEETDWDNKVTARKSKYDPSCVYIDAVNDENAIRKANNYIRGVKRGVVITYVSTHDPKDKGIKVKL